MELARLDNAAGTRHGLITRWRAEQLGVSRSGWYRAIASGELEQLYPNVARLFGTPDTFEQRTLAAVWATGPDAMASHRSSARLWSVERPEDDPIDVMLPRRSRYSMPPNVVVHRPRDILDLRPIMRHGIPTTSPMRMLLDLGAVDEDAVEAALIAVLASKVASPRAVHLALARHSKRGRHGVTALRLALDRWLSDELPPDSELEARMAELVARYRLPPVDFHVHVEGFEVDFLVRGSNIIIECDGWGTHGLDRDQFEFDRIRNSELAGAGYVVTHVTWAQLTNDPSAVAKRLHGVIQRWAPNLLTERTGRVSSRKPR